MNQILYTENQKNKGPLDIKIVLRIFGILCIIFGVCLSIVATVGLINGQKEANSSTYELHDYIPSYNIYKLSTNKSSYCTDSSGNSINATITYTNGEIVISSNQVGSCYVYLDIS